jgi:hypothetical protein
MCDLNSAWKEKAIQLESENRILKSRITPPCPPSEYEIITKDQVKVELLKTFSDVNMSNILDNRFMVTSHSEYMRFVSWDNTNIFDYESEYHDCDDYALALSGDFAKYNTWSSYPIGVAKIYWRDIDKAHAICFSIGWESFSDKTIGIYYIEPQDDHEIAYEMLEDADIKLLFL